MYLPIHIANSVISASIITNKTSGDPCETYWVVNWTLNKRYYIWEPKNNLKLWINLDKTSLLRGHHKLIWFWPKRPKTAVREYHPQVDVHSAYLGIYRLCLHFCPTCRHSAGSNASQLYRALQNQDLSVTLPPHKYINITSIFVWPTDRRAQSFCQHTRNIAKLYSSANTHIHI